LANWSRTASAVAVEWTQCMSIAGYFLASGFENLSRFIRPLCPIGARVAHTFGSDSRISSLKEGEDRLSAVSTTQITKNSHTWNYCHNFSLKLASLSPQKVSDGFNHHDQIFPILSHFHGPRVAFQPPRSQGTTRRRPSTASSAPPPDAAPPPPRRSPDPPPEVERVERPGPSVGNLNGKEYI